MRAALILAVSLASASCHRQPDAPPPARAATGARWLDAFDAYPGARLLCEQNVLGNDMEIHWLSYVTTDEPERVARFYAAGRDAGRLELRSPDGNRILSIAPADGDYPKCEQAPHPDEKTVILVSQAFKH